MSRLFTFGCSFTNYKWMTWADILGQQYTEYYNWGQAGAGNLYIFNSVMEADQRFKFQPTDTVIVCWTNVAREDRYLDGRGWITLGNITTSPIFSKEFVANALCNRGNLIRDIACIKSVKEFLTSKKTCWQFLSMCPLLQPNPYDNSKITDFDILDLYQDLLNQMPRSFYDVLGHNFWEHDQHKRIRYPEGGVDYHPTTQEHLLYLDTVLPNWVKNPDLREQISATPVMAYQHTNGSCKQRRL